LFPHPLQYSVPGCFVVVGFFGGGGGGPPPPPPLLSQRPTLPGNSRSASPLWKLRNSRLFPRKKWSRKCLQAFQKDFGGVPDGHFLSFPGIPEKVASGPSVFSTFLGIPENLPSGPSRSSNLTIRTRNRHPDMESTSRPGIQNPTIRTTRISTFPGILNFS